MKKKDRLKFYWARMLPGMLLGWLLILGGCAASVKPGQEGGVNANGGTIDCEQEANKYRKPCRDKRW